ncbi:hypothetical protein D3C76_1409500 [compost metagenome]
MNLGQRVNVIAVRLLIQGEARQACRQGMGRPLLGQLKLQRRIRGMPREVPSGQLRQLGSRLQAHAVMQQQQASALSHITEQPGNLLRGSRCFPAVCIGYHQLISADALLAQACCSFFCCHLELIAPYFRQPLLHRPKRMVRGGFIMSHKQRTNGHVLLSLLSCRSGYQGSSCPE